MKHLLRVTVVLVTMSTIMGTPILPAIDDRLDTESSEDTSRFAGRSISSDISSSSGNGYQLIPVYYSQNSQEPLASPKERLENGTNGYGGGDNGEGNGTSTTSNATALLLPPASNSSSMLLNNSSAATVLRVRNDTENCTLEPAFLCLVDLVHYQRDKASRLNAIKEYVLRKLNMSVDKRPTNVDRNNILGQISPSSPFSGQLETLYASCDIPSNVDEDTWNNSPQSFNIYFKIPSSMYPPIRTTPATPVVDDESSESLRSFQAMMFRHSPQFRNGAPAARRPTFNLADFDIPTTPSTVSNNRRKGILKNSNVISAKLKLYKIGRAAPTESSTPEVPNPAEPVNETSADTTFGSSTAGFRDIEGIDEKVRVSVYWYTLPLKKHHFKKKLLDTKMLSVKESRWVEFDVQRATAMWLEKRENYGLVVQVENEDNDWVDARKIFAGLPCNPVADKQNGTNATSGNETIPEPQVLDILPPPVLEICTLSLPSAISVPATPNQQQPQEPQRRPSNHRNGHKHRHAHGEPSNHHNNHHRTRSNNNNNSHNQQNFRHRSQMNIETVEVPVYSELNQTESETSSPKAEASEDETSIRGFHLDEHHPLREILATVASSRETNRQRNSNKGSEGTQQDVDYNYFDDDVDEKDDDREVIIQKIYISPPVPQHHRGQQQQRQQQQQQDSSSSLSSSSSVTSSARHRRGQSDVQGGLNR